MKNIALITIVLSSLAFCMNCGEKEKSPEFVEMIFVIPASVTPIQSLKIGDTLWLSANFPDTILELNSKKYYKLINIDFKELFSIFKLSNKDLTISEQPGGLSAFTILEKKGTLNDPSETFADLKFTYTNEKYSFMVGFVPSTIGIYCFNIAWPTQLHDGFDEGLNLENYIDLGVTSDGRRMVPIHKATYVVINNGETNFDLFQQNCKAVSLTVPTEGNIYYEQKGTFTFQVLE